MKRRGAVGAAVGGGGDPPPPPVASLTDLCSTHAQTHKQRDARRRRRRLRRLRQALEAEVDAADEAAEEHGARVAALEAHLGGVRREIGLAEARVRLAGRTGGRVRVWEGGFVQQRECFGGIAKFVSKIA